MNLEEKITTYLPTVKKPTFRVTFNIKLFWTAIVLIVYLTLSQIRVFGIPQLPEVSAQLRFFETVLASRIGSIMTLGIGPIVTAGIILQLLVGSKILNWNMTKEEYRKKFQLWNKLLAIIFSFLEGFAFTLSGFIPHYGDWFSISIISLQIAIGGILVLYLDEIVSKWGIGSGVSLFIAAGVTTQIFNSVFSPLPLPQPSPINPGPFVGYFWNFVNYAQLNDFQKTISSLVPIISTIIVILLVSFVSKTSVNLPLSFGQLRGFGRTWNLKLLYTSNIPVILAAALISNLTIISGLTSTLDPSTGESCGILGCLNSEKNPTSGFIYYVTSPRSLLIYDLINGNINSKEIIRGISYIAFLTLVATIFSVLWVNTASMDPKSISSQIKEMNLQIPGFRSSELILESVLNRYIPKLAVIGGALIGILAGFADVIGAIGTGTGILLTVMILENFYEAMKRERLEEAHPLIRRFLE
ncbi:MAG: preprotein translocase subunit SecY [Candidatus Aenigmarchaeota archaeon]|nr:preprotein translocase subunit SecY [Candidatus Aenigmarchaeota archaeon]MDW8148989.1 preprotein translocase subunit SecY [Candidatus Aenigmarchaeota archaeon]